MLVDQARRGDSGATRTAPCRWSNGVGPHQQAVARTVYPDSGGIDRVVGLTGAPGVGVSTLTDGVIRQARQELGPVGVLAATIRPLAVHRRRPSSATGCGCRSTALIPTFSSAPWPPGVISAVSRWRCPKRCGCSAPSVFTTIVIETVGVERKVEVEIAGALDTTVVVVTPGWGTASRPTRRACYEIADIFVINKADRTGWRGRSPA